MALNSQTVEISIDELITLQRDAAMYEALREAGVDNWEGYDYAVSLYREMSACMDDE